MLNGTLFVRLTGIKCLMFQEAMECGCGEARCRRLAEWQDTDLRQNIFDTLPARLKNAARIDWCRAVGGDARDGTGLITASPASIIVSLRRPTVPRSWFRSPPPT